MIKQILFVLIILATFISCGPSAEDISDLTSKAKYHVGDEVYIKPDSTKAVIVDARAKLKNGGCGCMADTSDYAISYEVRTVKGATEFIAEELIY